jgi:outer membrane protein TolC
MTIKLKSLLASFRKVDKVTMNGINLWCVTRALACCFGGAAMLWSVTGCHSKNEVTFDRRADFQPFALEIDYPDSSVQLASAIGPDPAPPHTIREPAPEDIMPISLNEAIQTALQNSEVMRDIGARVVTTPQSVLTVYDPALQQIGEEAALSAFDAQLGTSLFTGQDDRAQNSFFPGFAARTSSTNNSQFLAEISKVAATGTRFAVRNETSRASRNPFLEILDPAGNKVGGDLFRSYYDTAFEIEARHPLLQGGGIGYNRIAGPNATPGVYNGIVIARIRTDIALADFEASVRDLVEDVQTAYWLLYFAYRDLDARLAARDAALESWRTAKTQMEAGAGDILEESLAREQYFLFQTQVVNSLSGVGTDTSTTQTRFGIYALERRLRLLMGIAVNDQRLLRPSDEPSKAEVVFDWPESVDNAMFRRVELRRQRWTIRQREMELLAARNQLLVRLDLVGQYRWRGFGDDLLGSRSLDNGSAFRDLYGGDLQGWGLGLELSTPIGNRIGHAAVRQSELLLSRERALLREQERSILTEVSEAFNELDRAYEQSRYNYNRIIAARQRLSGEQSRYEFGQGVLQFVLDAQSRVADAEAEYFRSLIDYNLAVSKVHYAQGTLLDYAGVHLSEGPWSDAAYGSAARNAQRFKPRHLNYCITQPCPVSTGAFEQHVLPRMGMAGGPVGNELPTPAAEDAEIDRMQRVPQVEQLDEPASLLPPVPVE